MTTVPMLTTPVPAARAWTGRALPPERYLVPIPDEGLAEIEAMVAELRAAPVPRLLLLPEHFRLEAVGRLMARVRTLLDEGPGLAVLDRLPLDRLTKSEAVDVYWVLANLLEPPVAQDIQGTVIYDVRHDGRPYDAATRGALTPESLDLHNDSSMGEAPPHYLGLLCLETARAGGMSIVSSALTAHNHFLEHRPDLLRRLYEPFYREVMSYQAAGAVATNWRPVFTWNGGLRTRFHARHVFRGYEAAGLALDDLGREAIEAMDAFMSAPETRLDLWLERGQIEFLDNRVVLHGRTRYVDHDEPERRRHMVRLWLRAGDRRQFRG